MITEAQYNSLITYAKQHYGGVDPYDLVHSAILEHNTVEGVKSGIKALYFDEKRRLKTFGTKDNHALVNSKYCKKCEQDKPLDCFSVRIDKKTGFRFRWYCCKDCRNRMQKEWRVGKQEKYNKNRNDKYNNNPDWKEHVKITAKIWALKNKEKVKAIEKRRNEKNRQRKKKTVEFKGAWAANTNTGNAA